LPEMAGPAGDEIRYVLQVRPYRTWSIIWIVPRLVSLHRQHASLRETSSFVSCADAVFVFFIASLRSRTRLVISVILPTDFE